MAPPVPAATATPWTRLVTRARSLWSPPDPDLVHAGLRGEWLIAGVRLLIVIVLLYLPLRLYIDQPTSQRAQLLMWLSAAALSEALLIYAAARRQWARRWIGFSSGALDVTMVSVALGVFLLLDQPLRAIHDLVVFPVYFLAIGATALRYDWRISLLTGITAIFEYLAILVYAAGRWDLAHRALPTTLGAPDFRWPEQIARLGLLAMATLLAAVQVKRSRDHRHLSTRDRLTQLANRGFLDDSLERIAATAARSGESVTVAMIDVDRFKVFNDTWGHAVGDEALRAVARLLRTRFRSTDLLARYGGEEFVCVFPSMGAVDANRRLEELRSAMAEIVIPVPNDRRAALTVSIGGAVWPREAETLPQTLALADQRLYEAKAAGRNRVVTGPPDGDSVPGKAAEVPTG